MEHCVLGEPIHPKVEELVYYSWRLAGRQLRDGAEPLFAAVLDPDDTPELLNVTFHEEYDAPKTVGGLVELLRTLIRQMGTSGAIICAPIIIPTDEGTTYDGLRLHADHIDDTCAYIITRRYLIDENGELHGDEAHVEESEDRLLDI